MGAFYDLIYFLMYSATLLQLIVRKSVLFAAKTLKSILTSTLKLIFELKKLQLEPFSSNVPRHKKLFLHTF